MQQQLETFLRNFYQEGDFFGEMADRDAWGWLMNHGALDIYAKCEKTLTSLSKRMLTEKQQFYKICDMIEYDSETGYGSWTQLQLWTWQATDINYQTKTTG